MKKEFDLSKKIVWDNRHPEYDLEIIKAMDVKEFIRLIKHLTNLVPEKEWKMSLKEETQFIYFNDRKNKIIDQIAGDDLI